MKVVDFFNPVTVEPGKLALCRVDFATRYGIVAGADGPVKVDSEFRPVVVPTFDWSSQGIDENAEAAKVLLEMSAFNPLKLSRFKELNPAFWVKYNWVRALLVPRGIVGKVCLPESLSVFAYDIIPANIIVALGPQSMVGYYVKQGYRRGLLTADKRGTARLEFGGEVS